MLSFRLNNCNLRSSRCSFFFRILILTSCSSFKCSSYIFLMFLSLCPCSLTESKSGTVWLFCLFSPYTPFFLLLLRSSLATFCYSTILSGPTGRYDEVDDRLYFSMAPLEASKVCSLAWILSPESIPPTIDTR